MLTKFALCLLASYSANAVQITSKQEESAATPAVITTEGPACTKNQNSLAQQVDPTDPDYIADVPDCMNWQTLAQQVDPTDPDYIADVPDCMNWQTTVQQDASSDISDADSSDSDADVVSSGVSSSNDSSDSASADDSDVEGVVAVASDDESDAEASDSASSQSALVSDAESTFSSAEFSSSWSAEGEMSDMEGGMDVLPEDFDISASISKSGTETEVDSKTVTDHVISGEQDAEGDIESMDDAEDVAFDDEINDDQTITIDTPTQDGATRETTVEVDATKSTTSSEHDDKHYDNTNGTSESSNSTAPSQTHESISIVDASTEVIPMD